MAACPLMVATVSIQSGHLVGLMSCFRTAAQDLLTCSQSSFLTPRRSWGPLCKCNWKMLASTPLKAEDIWFQIHQNKAIKIPGTER